MANSEHLAKLHEGVQAWNEWRSNHSEVIPNLEDAQLQRLDLNGANLSGSLLRGANFAEATLRGANLSDANLTQAGLGLCNLTEANLARANLKGAFLDWAVLSSVLIDGADLTGAYLFFTIFANTDLSATKGLDAIQHEGPCFIDMDTVYQSHGRIPSRFLRGAGVPENFIEYMPSLVAPGAIQFYSCFISYSTKDQEFADRLYADLQNKGVRCWFAPEDVQGGKKLHEQIDEAIRRYERLLLILSPNSMSSEWVKTEIRKARKRERTEKKRVLFPVRLVSYDALRDWELVFLG